MSALKWLMLSTAVSYWETAIIHVHIQVCVSDGQRLSVLLGEENDIINKLVVARGDGVVGRMKEVKKIKQYKLPVIYYISRRGVIYSMWIQSVL